MPDLRRGTAALAALLVLVLLAGIVPAAPAAASAAAPAPRYRPPVEAPVSDPFRAPAHAFGPGNRGLEYDTPPGTVVRAAADGEVVFAGAVAGTRHVTVLHADGLRTSSSRLGVVAVVVGERVRQGDVLGLTEGRLHFGVRDGDSYLDPATLFTADRPRVWLVPFDLPPGSGPGGERSALRQLLGLGQATLGVLGDLANAPGHAFDWAMGHAPESLRLLVEYGTGFLPPLRLLDAGIAGVTAIRGAIETLTRACSAAEVVVPPPEGRRIVLLVAGLGSTSEHGDVDRVDTAALGYDPADVLRFSYAGGVTPGSPGHPEGIDARRYQVDSQQDLRTAGRRLADLVEDVVAAEPGVPIDLVGHSQGGLVARLALAELERRGSAEAVAFLATIATPHEGSDLATAARLVGLSPTGAASLDLALGAAVGLDPDLPAMRQLAETSDLIQELGRTPLPPGLEAVSIAARTDPVVAVPRTELDGAAEVVVGTSSPLAHGELPGDPRATREIGLARAGLAPGCRSVADAVADQVVGGAIGLTVDTVAPYLADLAGQAGPAAIALGAR